MNYCEIILLTGSLSILCLISLASVINAYNRSIMQAQLRTCKYIRDHLNMHNIHYRMVNNITSYTQMCLKLSYHMRSIL